MMLTKFLTKYWAYFLIGIISIGIIYLSLITKGLYGGADEYHHYRIARYAFYKPELFFDLWGKPLYTFLCGFFSQFGFQSAKLFNAIIGIATLLVCFKIASLRKHKFPLLAVFILCCCPIYILMLPTVMTEPLFALVISLGIYLILYERPYAAAILLSFLPYARQEGYGLLAVFAVIFILQRNYKAIPLLAIGTVFISIIGNFFLDDILWVLHNQPYTYAGQSFYGKGELFHYINKYDQITGLPIAIFFLLGVGLMTVYTIKHCVNNKSRSQFIYWCLIIVPIFVFVAGHSYVWWKGTSNSAGLARVMASIMPLIAITTAEGIDILNKKTPYINKYFKYTFITLIFGWMLYFPLNTFEIPTPLSTTNKLAAKTMDWLKNSEYSESKFYYHDPYFLLAEDLNPYDDKKVKERIPNNDKPEIDIKPGELILWDAHLSANEGGLPLINLIDNRYYEVLKAIRPKESFTVIGGYNYEIYVFKRLNFPRNYEKRNVVIYNEDFETPENIPLERISDKYSFSGQNSFSLDKNHQFVGPITPYSTFNGNPLINIYVSAKVYFEKLNEPFSLIISVENKGNKIQYKAIESEKLNLKENTWNDIYLEIVSPTEHKNPDDEIRTYIWYRGENEIFVDDMHVEVLEKIE